MSDLMDTLRLQVISCTKCNLSKSRTNAVAGKGNYNAEIMFIGEAPGRNEDLKGEPFVGMAGKILTEALEYAGLSRDDVFITNVVKCRPPNNRIPLEEEKNSCQQFLIDELDIIKPKIICILGNTAYGSILGGGSITKNRGKIIKKNDHLYFLTIHPAAVIYTPDLKQVLKDDIKTLVKTLEKIKKGIQVETLS
ncbi:MAG TPA: uracil-DNA glycosylase [Nitrosopumilaceae archaeon]|nr:uracil-DNA glycosylase [Nitrosopumilaceae archaeon]